MDRILRGIRWSYLIGLEKEFKVFNGSPKNPFEGAYTRLLLLRDRQPTNTAYIPVIVLITATISIKYSSHS